MSSAAVLTLQVTDRERIHVTSEEQKTTLDEEELNDGNRNEKTEPIQLCQFLSATAQSPLACIKRTARYAENPTGYLKDVMGTEAFKQRRPLLSIPDVIDRDFYGIGKHKQNFEQHIANVLGKKCGLFFISGVQAQLIAINIHCEQIGNFRVAWHVSSHLESAEEEAYKTLYGLNRILLGAEDDENPSVEDIKKVLSRPETCRPAAIVLEIPNRTLGCKTYSFEDLETISRECRKANVRLHCDGARLWEIEPHYQETAGKSIKDLGALFDSIYVSFYKGLQGSSGAMLASTDINFITCAKKWQRRAGGNVFTLQYQVIDAERGFNENIGTFAARREKMRQIVARIKGSTSKFRTQDGLPYIQFVPDEPTCCQTNIVFQGSCAEELIAARDRVQERTNVRVFEKLRQKQTVDELLKAERNLKTATRPDYEVRQHGNALLYDTTHSMEWMLVEATQDLDVTLFVDGYVALCKELQSRS